MKTCFVAAVLVLFAWEATACTVPDESAGLMDDLMPCPVPKPAPLLSWNILGPTIVPRSIGACYILKVTGRHEDECRNSASTLCVQEGLEITFDLTMIPADCPKEPTR